MNRCVMLWQTNDCYRFSEICQKMIIIIAQAIEHVHLWRLHFIYQTINSPMQIQKHKILMPSNARKKNTHTQNHNINPYTNDDKMVCRMQWEQAYRKCIVRASVQYSLFRFCDERTWTHKTFFSSCCCCC